MVMIDDSTAVRHHMGRGGSEIRLRDMVALLWRRRLWILCFVVLVTGGAAVAAVLWPREYVATTVVAPVTNDSGSGQFGGIASLVSQVGGLAGLAGISMPGGSEKNEAVAVLQSEALTEDYIRKSGLISVLDHGRGKVTTLWQANQYFKKYVRTVTTDTKTGLVTLSIEWKNPEQAAAWANELVKLTNEMLRNRAIAEGTRHIAYLNEQAAKTEAVDIKQGIYSILQSEIGKMMLAKGRDEYALKVIDPAFAPEKPLLPRPKLWILGAFIGGVILSIFAAFLWLAWSAE